MAHAEKIFMMEKVRDQMKKATGLMVTSFTGLDVVALNSLRRKLEKGSARFIVTKNTLLKRALKEAKKNDAVQFLSGMSGVAVCEQDSVTMAKTLFAFAKDHESFTVRGGIIDGEVLVAAQAKELSQLPSREVLLATVLMRMKSPITGLVNVLAGSMRGMVVVLDKIRQQKAG